MKKDGKVPKKKKKQNRVNYIIKYYGPIIDKTFSDF